MNPQPLSTKMTRRNFLKLAAAAGVTAAGGAAISYWSPWLNMDQQVSQTWSAANIAAGSSLPSADLIHYASLAANGHNTQPWKFAAAENSIEIYPDYSRELAVVDPDHRELWISLGCALENLLIAARAAGYEPSVTYPDSADLIRVQFQPGEPQSGALMQAIPMRQNTRSEYDGQPVNSADFAQLQAMAIEEGVALRYLTSSGEIEQAVEYVNQGNLAQYADKAFVNELIDWLRFNKKEAMSSLDGLYSRCSGNPEVPRWLGQSFVAGTKPQQQADADAKKLRSSSGAVVIATDADSKAAWVRAGQVYERLALTMTSLNIKSAFLNQPIEVSGLRGQFQSAMGMGNAAPQLLVRYGYAEAMPRSLRRPVEDIIL